MLGCVLPSFLLSRGENFAFGCCWDIRTLCLENVFYDLLISFHRDVRLNITHTQLT